MANEPNSMKIEKVGTAKFEPVADLNVPQYERVGSGYDPGAVGYELAGRDPKPMTPLERAARAAREEIVRQYREDERGKCPGGSAFYEEHVGPWQIARAVLTAIREPSEAMVKAGDAWRAHCSDTDSLFEEMIDAALTEEG